MSAAEGEPVGSAPGDPVGSAAEEAARLVDALQGWFGARAGAQVGAPAHAVPADPEAPRQHGPACRACPVCRGVAYVREAHPEVVEHLVGAAQHVAAALRALSEPATEQATRPEPQASTKPGDVDPDLPNSGPSEQEPEP